MFMEYDPMHQAPAQRGTVMKCDFCPEHAAIGVLEEDDLVANAERRGRLLTTLLADLKAHLETGLTRISHGAPAFAAF